MRSFSRVSASSSCSRSPSQAREPLDIGGAAAAVADRVQLEVVLGDAEIPEQRVVEVQYLGVERGVVRADRLHRELPVLAIAPAARPAVAVHRRDRVELLRLRLLLETVAQVGAADRRGSLRAQRQGAVAAVGEGVHLLLDDVRALTRRAQEEVGVLEPRRLDRPVAVEGAEPLHLACDALPERLLGGRDVVRPPRRLEPHDARSSARNGLRASSSPSVVCGPCPEWTIVSGGIRVGERSDRARGARPSRRTGGRCGRPNPRRGRRRRTDGRRRSTPGARESGLEQP